MSKDIVVGIVIILGLIITLVVFNWPQKKTFPDNLGITINNQDYYLEVAQNTQQRTNGLSNRIQLCSNCGMLFVFKKEGIYPFWMKDTKIPLDMIWLNSENQIVKIVTALETNSTKNYSNDKPARYVIELNANEVFKLGLKIGDTVPISNVDNQ